MASGGGMTLGASGSRCLTLRGCPSPKMSQVIGVTVGSTTLISWLLVVPFSCDLHQSLLLFHPLGGFL